MLGPWSGWIKLDLTQYMCHWAPTIVSQPHVWIFKSLCRKLAMSSSSEQWACRRSFRQDSVEPRLLSFQQLWAKDYSRGSSGIENQREDCTLMTVTEIFTIESISQMSIEADFQPLSWTNRALSLCTRFAPDELRGEVRNIFTGISTSM